MTSRVLNLVLKRLGIAAITLLIVLFAVFFATSMLPGDTASILLGQAATPKPSPACASHASRDPAIPLPALASGLLHGDLGTSYANEMVAALIGGAPGTTVAGITAASVPLARRSASPPPCCGSLLTAPSPSFRS